MSQGRAVASAQKRRNAPMDYPPQQPRGPSTSIHSSQVFSQQQSQQGSIPGKNMQYKASEPTKGQMTVPQAITLITLRLGRLESQIQKLNVGNSEYESSFLENSTENASFVDKSLIQSIVSRLESLEKRSTVSNSITNSSSNTEVQSLKAQIEALKPIVGATKNLSVSHKKDITELKNELEMLKNFFNETKTLVDHIQNHTEETSQKIITLETAFALNNDLDLNFGETQSQEEYEEESILQNTNIINMNDLHEEILNHLSNDIHPEIQNTLTILTDIDNGSSLEIHDSTMYLDLQE